MNSKLTTEPLQNLHNLDQQARLGVQLSDEEFDALAAKTSHETPYNVRPLIQLGAPEKVCAYLETLVANAPEDVLEHLRILEKPPVSQTPEAYLWALIEQRQKLESNPLGRRVREVLERPGPLVGWEFNWLLNHDPVAMERQLEQAPERRAEACERLLMPAEYLETELGEAALLELLENALNAQDIYITSRFTRVERLQPYLNGPLIRAIVLQRVKGGFSADVGGLRCFLPMSQLPKGTPPERLFGNRFAFRIIKLNAKRGNVVLSMTAAAASVDEATRLEAKEFTAEALPLPPQPNAEEHRIFYTIITWPKSQRLLYSALNGTRFSVELRKRLYRAFRSRMPGPAFRWAAQQDPQLLFSDAMRDRLAGYAFGPLTLAQQSELRHALKMDEPAGVQHAALKAISERDDALLFEEELRAHAYRHDAPQDVNRLAQRILDQAL